MTTRVVLNRQGFIDVLTSPGVVALVTERANRAAEHVRDDEHDETFAYEQSVSVVVDVTPGSRALPRARARVVVTDRKAFILEAKYGILARALDLVGGR